MIDVRFKVGNLGYRLRVRQDRHRGGYEAVLTTDDGGPLMMPNGSSPGDAIARLVRELTAGDAFDRKIAKQIVQRTGFPGAFNETAKGQARSHATKKSVDDLEPLQESPSRKAEWLHGAKRRFPVGSRVRVVKSDESRYVGVQGTVIDYDLGPMGSWPLIRVKLSAPIAGTVDGFYGDGKSDDEIVRVRNGKIAATRQQRKTRGR